jgi:hypothetical protein
VSAVDAEVSRDGDFFLGADPQYSAIVSDAKADASTTGTRKNPNAAEKFQFAVRNCRLFWL